jgi:hypothetical protein
MNRLARLQQRYRVTQLLSDGATVEEIAEVLALPEKTVRREITKATSAMRTITDDAIARAREVHNERLEELLEATMPSATAEDHIHSFGKDGEQNIAGGPSPAHANLALNILTQQAKLLGLNAPTKTESKQLIARVDLSEIPTSKLEERRQALLLKSRTIDALEPNPHADEG